MELFFIIALTVGWCASIAAWYHELKMKDAIYAGKEDNYLQTIERLESENAELRRLLQRRKFKPFLIEEIPFHRRYEHQWVVAPPGSGKSHLLTHLILKDLDFVARGLASVVVMESNRDLIKSIERLARFGPNGDLAGKLIILDAEDVEYPVALALFNPIDLSAPTPRDREALYNSTTSLLSYVFRALLDAEMTSRQSTLFSFSIALMLAVKGATLDTLIDLLQKDGRVKFAREIALLDPDARRFFNEKFDSKELEPTKSQVVDRLFAIKRARTLSRMFNTPNSRLDLYSELSKGRVILINTSKSLLQEEGTELLSRFFLALILLAAEKRATLPKHQRLPTFVYIDEAQDVIRRDEKLPVLLDTARKFRVGLILAHQRPEQMQKPVLDALMGSTAIKMVAGLSDSGAHMFSRNMGVQIASDLNYITQGQAHAFALFSRGDMPRAIAYAAPALDLSRTMSEHDFRAIIEDMRRRYSSTAAPPPPPKKPDHEEDTKW